MDIYFMKIHGAMHLWFVGLALYYISIFKKIYRKVPALELQNFIYKQKSFALPQIYLFLL